MKRLIIATAVISLLGFESPAVAHGHGNNFAVGLVAGAVLGSFLSNGNDYHRYPVPTYYAPAYAYPSYGYPHYYPRRYYRRHYHWHYSKHYHTHYRTHYHYHYR